MSPKKPTYQETKLANGMRIASEALPSRTVGIMIDIATGTRDEEPHENGLPHFLEHMAFKGTTTKNTRELGEAMAEMGRGGNAETEYEHTRYYLQVNPEDFEKAVRFLCDIVTNPAFDPKELASECKVVLEEISKYADQPEATGEDLVQTVAFGKSHPLGRPILGTRQNVKQLTAEHLREFHEKHYEPRRMVFAAAGVGIDHKKFADIVEEYFGKRTNRSEPVKRQPAVYVGGEMQFGKQALEQLQLRVGLPIKAGTLKDELMLDVFCSILAAGEASRAWDAIRGKEGLAYTVEAHTGNFREYDLMNFGMGIDPKRVDVATRTFKEVFRSFETTPITEKELECARTHLRLSYNTTFESPINMAEEVVETLQGRGDYISPEEKLSVLDSITLDDIRQMAKTILSAKPSVVALGPPNSLRHADGKKRNFTAELGLEGAAAEPPIAVTPVSSDAPPAITALESPSLMGTVTPAPEVMATLPGMAS